MIRFKRVIFSILSSLILATSVCSASEIPISDSVTINNFIQAYNNTNIREKFNIRLTSVKDKSPSDHGEVVYLITFNTDKNLGNAAIIFTDKIGNILQTDIVIKNISNEAALRTVMGEMLMLQRTVGTPSGPDTAKGMFAMIDALKKGKASYWDEYSARRYVLRSYREKTGCYQITMSASDT